MTAAPTLADLVRAEALKLLGRTSVRLALALLLVVAVGVPVLGWFLSLVLDVEPVVHGTTPDAAQVGLPEIHGASVAGAVLGVRNFFLFRVIVIAVVAVSFAGELVSRTLREDLVRPVSRGMVLGAKWGALQLFVLAGVLLPFLVGAPLSALLFGVDGAWGAVFVRYVLTWLGDAGFATLVVAISLAVRSVPGTIGGVFLYWVIDFALGRTLWVIEQFRDALADLFRAWGSPDLVGLVDAAIAVRPWLPSSAFELAWDYDPGVGLPWRSALALVLYTALSYGVALVVFRRTDVD